MTAEAAIGGMWARALEHLEPQEARRGGKASTPAPPEGAGPYDTLSVDAWPPDCERADPVV